VASWLGFDLRGRAVPITFGASLDGAALSARRLELGAGLRVGDLQVGGVRLAGLVEYGYGRGSISGGAVDLRLARHLLGFGLRASPAPRAAPVAVAMAAAVAPPFPVAPALPAPAEAPPPVEAPPAPPAAAVRGTLWSVTVSAVPGRNRRVPLAQAAVSWTGAGPGAAEVRSDPQGQFVLEGLAAGSGTLKVEAPGFVPVEKPLEVTAGESQAVDLTLEALSDGRRAIIRGTVRSSRGRRVRATLEIPEARLRRKPNKAGAFAFEVPPGRYTLQVGARGYVSQKKTVELGGGEESIFTIELHRRRR
jgi:hypothetical protein